ncbi:MAG TPA: ATP-binding protein [Acidobacteriota bacterium]|nr:ATP-binding protein [Acidobacteriota bacterium]
MTIALADTPVVLVNGARQTGKTTLVQKVAAEKQPSAYFSLDDAATLSAVRADPTGFLAALDGLVVIDEVQKAPGLLSALKVAVDRDRRPGRFLLTGSADVLMLPEVSESLAGRMEILTLWPFSQGEIEGKEDCLLELLFEDRLDLTGLEDAEIARQWVDRVIRGGFPEVVRREDQQRRQAWLASYLTAILQRDIRDLANIEGLTEVPRLLSLLAARVGYLLNKAELSRATQLPYTTLKRYLSLLELTFLVQPLPAWSGNLGKRLTRSPKMHLCDSALTAHLNGLTEDGLGRRPELKGPLLENFAVMELRKQASWCKRHVSLFHYRTHTNQEVDIVLEDRAGTIVGIEVKATATLGKRAFKGLEALAHDAGDRFLRGIVLYTGGNPLTFTPKHHALPLSVLWQATPQKRDVS